MVLDVRAIREKAAEDFEAAWLASAELLPKKGEVILTGRGNEHPVHKVSKMIREALLDCGFDEIENRFILDENDVYKQYGPEAPVILDRCFYLAALPRPELGIGKDKEKIIAAIDPAFDEKKKEALGKILRGYKSGEIEGDDFVETLVKALGWKMEQATAVMDDAFPELKSLKPVATSLVLRSHMTAVWFETLAAVQHTRKHPVALFSIGPRFRNEQKEDAGHLRVHYGASLVLMGEGVSLEAGNELARKFLEKIGFSGASFKRKVATSKYYAHESEYEIFAKLGNSEVEVGDVGLYSPIALANYGIEYPVYNAGFGIERIASILHKTKDIRELAFPQFYGSFELTDRQIADAISIGVSPLSNEGRQLQKKLFEETVKHKDAETPFKVGIQFKISGKEVNIEIFKDEAGKKLLGPAGMNRVYVHDGSILAFDPAGKEFEGKQEVIGKGLDTGITFLEAITHKAAREIERAAAKGEKLELMFPIAKGPSDVNISLGSHVYRYVTGKKKKIDFRGPIFFGVRVL